LFGPVAVSFLVHDSLLHSFHESIFVKHSCISNALLVNLCAWLTGLTAVWAGSSLLCSVQVPCYEVRGATALHQQAWRVLAAPPGPRPGEACC
jgi:hypothetical protein